MPPLDLNLAQALFAGLVCGAAVLMIPVLLLVFFGKGSSRTASITDADMWGIYK